MTQIKSVPTFIRRQLKFKGLTEHNGRGVYMMEFDCTPDELRSSVYILQSKWKEKGLVVAATIDQDVAMIEFAKSACVDEYYRQVRFHYNTTSASVIF